MAKTIEKVGQLADIANKEFGRFAARLRRIGHDKPGKQMASIDVSKLDHTTQVLYARYLAAEEALEKEAKQPGQPTLDDYGLKADDEPDNADPLPDDNTIHLLRERFEAAAKGLPRVTLTEEKVEEILGREMVPTDGGASGPIKATVITLFEDRNFVIIGGHPAGNSLPGFVTLNEVVVASKYSGDTFLTFDANKPFHSQKGVKIEGRSRQKWVTLGVPLVGVGGDPLAENTENASSSDAPAQTAN